MIVKKAKVLGFCMGVRCAIDSVFKAVKENKNNMPIYTFGPLIHNPPTMKMLETIGVHIINPDAFDECNKYDNSIIVIRAHGIPPLKKSELEKTGALIIDCTCSRVKKSQKLAREHSKNSLVILAGDKNHGELISIAGYAKDECLIIQNAEEAASIDIFDRLKEKKSAVLIAQTTIKDEEYKAIAYTLKKRIEHLTVLNTICPATFKRQEALKTLAEEVDALLVIGGKNSANTKRLFYTALETKKPAWLIESAVEIPKEIFNYSVVGLTAGASTPDFIIDEVASCLK